MQPNNPSTLFKPANTSTVAKAEKEHIKLNSENRIIVRVWYPKIQGQPASQWNAIVKVGIGQSNANVGHVSLETPNEYVSLWPNTANMNSAFKRYRSCFNTLREDEFDESGPCDFITSFYSLNISAIEQAFEKVKDTPKGYVLAGDSSLAEPGGHSCCSMVYCLLRAGGIERFHPERGSSMASGLMTPAEFADFLKEAKMLEVIDYPETADFERMEGEYFPARNQKCTII